MLFDDIYSWGELADNGQPVPCPLAPTATIEQLRAFNRNNFEDRAVICGGCDQIVAVNSFGLNASLAAALVVLYGLRRDNPNRESFHVDLVYQELKRRSHDVSGGFRRHLALLRFWGLSTMLGDGLHTPTPNGRRFVQGTRRVPKYVATYNREQHGQAYGDLINIDDALTTRFNRQELLGSNYTLHG